MGSITVATCCVEGGVFARPSPLLRCLHLRAGYAQLNLLAVSQISCLECDLSVAQGDLKIARKSIAISFPFTIVPATTEEDLLGIET